MNGQWNKINIICENKDDAIVILNGKIYQTKLQLKFQLQEENSIRRASKLYEIVCHFR